MTDKANEYISEIQRKVAESDAQANANLADILAGRPFKRHAPPKAENGVTAAPVPKKPRAKRAPKKRPVSSED